MQSLNKIEATQLVESTIFHTIDFVLVDSTVDLTSRDTLTRVRFVRASTTAQTTSEAVETRTQVEDLGEMVEETTQNQMRSESNKKGLASLCADSKFNFILILIFFFIIVILCVKKSLPLRR